MPPVYKQNFPCLSLDIRVVGQKDVKVGSTSTSTYKWALK